MKKLLCILKHKWCRIEGTEIYFCLRCGERGILVKYE